MAYSVSPPGEPPFYVEIGASDAAGPTFQTTFVSNADAVFLQPINICRAKIETGLIRTLVLAHRTIDDPQMRLLIHPEPV
jgi:hypothetical protein